MSLTRRGFVWAVVALLGIAVAAALTWSVTKLAAQRIGLSSEPVSVIQGLAPAHPQRETRPKIAASQDNGESSRPSAKGDGPSASVPAPVGASPAPSVAVPAVTSPASPPLPAGPAPPVAVTGPPATAAPPTSSSPGPTAQASSPAAASAAATGPANAADHPDDSGGGSHRGSNGGHSGPDD